MRGILWKDLGLQNREKEFDSLIPRHKIPDRIISHMKKVSTREIKITCTSYELEYTLTEANQNSKNICLSVRAVNKLQSSDEAHIIVKNPKGKIVSNKVYTGDYIKKKVVDIGQDSYVLFKY